MKKAVSSFLAIVILASGLAGCTGGEKSKAPDTTTIATTDEDLTEEATDEQKTAVVATDGQKTAEAATDEQEAAKEAMAEQSEIAEDESSDEGAQVAAEDSAPKSITDVVAVFINAGAVKVSDGANEVVNALNEIIQDDIGVRADVEWIEIGQWREKLSLKLSGGEQIDLMTVAPMFTVDTMQSQNQVLDISDYLNEYAAETLAMVGELIPAMTYGDEIYGVPYVKDYQIDYGYAMNREVLEELDMLEFAEEMETWTEFEELLTKVKEAHPEMAPMNVVAIEKSGLVNHYIDTSADKFSDTVLVNSLSDPYFLVNYNNEADAVESFFESEGYAKMIARADDWFKKGLLNKDGANTVETGGSMMASRSAFCNFLPIEGPSTQATVEALYGYPVYLKTICPGDVATLTATIWGLTVPYTAEEPEAGVKLLNALMTNSEVQTLLQWGIEGRDYEINDIGQAQYPEGIDQNNVPYHTTTFTYGNMLIGTPWEGVEQNHLDEALDKLVSGDIRLAPHFGLLVDTSDIINEVTACNNILEEYRGSLEAGSTEDYEATLKEFSNRLQSAGIEKVLEVYQAAIDDSK